MHILTIVQLQRLIEIFQDEGREVIGPTRRDGAIVYESIDSVDDLPAGWTDEQAPGTYRLKRRNDGALFGYVVSPTSWKAFLFPPKLSLWKAKRVDKGFEVQPSVGEEPSYVFLGVRGCELKAIEIQDKVFRQGTYQDEVYRRRREKLFVIAVNCAQAASTCFCSSMNTGPEVRGAYDLLLTEIIDQEQHYFLVKSGSPRGEAILEKLSCEPAKKSGQEAYEAILQKTREQIARAIDQKDLKDRLWQNQEHPHWSEIARRCLSCANCTMSCPTCFCSSVEDTTDLTGDHAQRWRMWDSCFNKAYSYIHGGVIRESGHARYRQWMTHKLAGWQDQFGVSGCVGCGRCITWCPSGIDITAEIKEIVS